MGENILNDVINSAIKNHINLLNDGFLDVYPKELKVSKENFIKKYWKNLFKGEA